MKANLTQSEAEERFSIVDENVRYNVYLNLKKGDSYNGVAKTSFRLKKLNTTFIDYSGSSIDFMVINGKSITKDQINALWSNGKVSLSASDLKINVENIILIGFSSNYYKNKVGLHSFTDTDKNQYLYNQAQPFWNNTIFPVFDQPDIKGRMNFIFQSPSDWVIISNSDKLYEIDLQADFQSLKHKIDFFAQILNTNQDDFSQSIETKTIHIFKETFLVSSYLFSFAAGPFSCFIYDEFDGPSVPMRIFCRKSLENFTAIQQNDVFIFAKRGIEIYEQFYQVPYKFEKLDFVFCPEYSIGGMEYPGMITITDNFIFKQSVNANNISGRGKCILHELSHMWFGDYVTMKWWNDLWLNESFADFSCYFAFHWMKPTLKLSTVDAMALFQDRKTVGYKADQEITTHPIAAEVLSTERAKSIFDMITYSKGAAVLKQLYFLIGHDQFTENLHYYFHQYGWKNTTTMNFFSVLTRQENVLKSDLIDLKSWFKDWIETAGCNQISCDFNPTKTGECVLKIFQNPVLSEFPTLRNHKILIAFFKEDGSIGETRQVNVEKAPVTIVKYFSNDYKAVLLNYEDWSFVKIVLDKFSLAFFKQNLKKMTDILSIMLITQSLFDMVKDGIFKATDFVDFMLDGFLESIASNPLLLESTVNFLHTSIQIWTPRKLQKDTFSKVFDKIYEILLKENPTHEMKILKTSLIRSGRGDENKQILKSLVLKTNPLALKLKLTNPEKWMSIVHFPLSKDISKEEIKSIVDLLSATDKSEFARIYIKKIEALQANEDQIEELWKRLASPDRKESAMEMDSLLICMVINIRVNNLTDKYYYRYFEEAFKLIVHDEQSRAIKFFDMSLIDSDRFDESISLLEQMTLKIDEKNETFKIKIRQRIENLKQKKKLHRLYENK